MNKWEEIGKELLAGKRIKEIVLREKRIELNDKQSEFISNLSKRYCLNSGGYGSGKSLALDIKMVLFCKCFPKNRVLLGRKTLSDLDRSILPDLFDLMPPGWYDYKVKDGLINFKNGSQIVLFGLDALQQGNMADIKKAQQKLKSLNLGAYFIDQLEEVEYEVFESLNSRLRKMDVPVRQGNMTCNPANFWAYQFFKLKQRRDMNGIWLPKKEDDILLIESSMLENKEHLPEDYLKDQLAMGDDYVKRFVLGQWTTDIMIKGSVFPKEYIQKLEICKKAPLEIKEECEIYEEPKNNEIYRMGVDPSEGIIDPASITVISGSGHKVAKYNGYTTIPGLADKIKFLYYKYNKPLIIPEVNKSAILEHIKDLRIYKRRQFDYKDRRETEKLGFVMSWASKQALTSRFLELLRKGGIRIYDANTIEEMKSFVYQDEASSQGASASRGFHDDDVISTMLAFWEFKPTSSDDFFARKAIENANNKPKFFQYR